MGNDRELLAEIAELLAQPAYRDHPLQAALSELYQRHLEQESRLERLVAIADGFQRTAQEDLHATRHELQRQIRRQRKVTRIADRYQALLGERTETLLGESHHDALTGLANRRLMNEHLEQLLAAKRRHQRPFTVAMIDIDHFKRINDEHGHAVGDEALVLLADVLQNALRTNDLCGRWGGEEFLVILPDTTLERAEPLMTRLCQCIRDLDIHYQSKHLHLTASLGVAEHRDQESIDQTLQRADTALLRAKREGRDRWLAAGRHSPPRKTTGEHGTGRTN